MAELSRCMSLLWEMESWERSEQCITTAAPQTVLPCPCPSGSQASTRSTQATRKKAVRKGGGKHFRNFYKEPVEKRGRFFLLHFRCQRQNYYLLTETKYWLEKRRELEAPAEKRDTSLGEGKKGGLAREDHREVDFLEYEIQRLLWGRGKTLDWFQSKTSINKAGQHI